MGAPSAAAGAGDAKSLGPYDSAWLAFRTPAGTGTPVVRVVEDGRVVGAVDRQRLKESLARRDGDEHAA